MAISTVPMELQWRLDNRGANVNARILAAEKSYIRKSLAFTYTLEWEFRGERYQAELKRKGARLGKPGEELLIRIDQLRPEEPHAPDDKHYPSAIGLCLFGSVFAGVGGFVAFRTVQALRDKPAKRRDRL